VKKNFGVRRAAGKEKVSWTGGNDDGLFEGVN
jgi:hypothetical protein